jgi:hypothetical protein
MGSKTQLNKSISELFGGDRFLGVTLNANAGENYYLGGNAIKELHFLLVVHGLFNREAYYLSHLSPLWRLWRDRWPHRACL